MLKEKEKIFIHFNNIGLNMIVITLKKGDFLFITQILKE